MEINTAGASSECIKAWNISNRPHNVADMKGFSVSIYLLLALGLTVHHVLSRYTKESSEFNLDGDFLLGGLFNIHLANGTILDRPEAIDCSR
jgi:hypothetical protein